MDPKDEKIRAGTRVIQDALNEWGLRTSSPPRIQKEAQVIKWLRNFKPSEIEDAFAILSKIQYKDDHLIRDAISVLSKEIKKIFDDEFSEVKFFPLGKSPSSSGGMYLYDFRKELGLSEDNFPYTQFTDHLTSTRAFVFFDDIIGSGNQATKFAKKHLQSLPIKAYYIAIFAFEEGLRNVTEKAYFEKVFCGNQISDEERAFHEISQVFADRQQRERLKQMCEKYGKSLFPQHPLGYDNSQALLVFPHNTPNNTLPIIWASTENEKRPNVIWYPLWERRKKSTKRTTLIVSNSYPHYDSLLVGRETELKQIKSFLMNTNQHFLLIYGVGGIGKTHLVSKTLDQIDRNLIYHQCNKDFTLDKLLRICRIEAPKIIKNPDEKTTLFLKQFIEGDFTLVLDDFYEVQDQDVRNLLTKMIHIHRGKLLVISRAIPRELNKVTEAFLKFKIEPLKKGPYFELLQDYASWRQKSLALSIEHKEKIYEKTLGHPLGGHHIIGLLALGEDLDTILRNVVKLDAQLDPEGKHFSSSILSVIFEMENPEEVQLFCQFCCFTEPVGIKAVKALPTYNLKVLEALILRKDLIWVLSDGKLTTHPLFREFGYERIQDKNKTHGYIAGYYECIATNRALEDIDSFEMALNHYRAAGAHELENFRSRMTEVFRSKNVKELIDENIDSTIRRLSYVNKLYPDYLPYYNELGIAYRGKGELDKAIEVLQRGLEFNPDDDFFRNELGITYREKGDLDKAIEVLIQAAEKGSPHSLNELGITYREKGDLDKAIEVLQRGLEFNPDDDFFRNELGITYRAKGDLDKAIEVLRQAAEKGHLPSLNELGKTYREKGDLDKAIEVLRHAAEKGHLHSLNELGKTYRANGDIDKAIEVLRQAAEKGNLHSLNELGIIYREKGDLDKAIEVLRQAAEKGHLPSLNELGINYREKGDLDKAIEVFRQAAEKSHLPSLNELGIIYREKGDIDKAIEVLRQAAEKGHLPSLNELGITYREKGDLDNAIEVLRQAAEKGNLPSLNELGITYREKGDLDRAIEVLRQATEKGHLPSLNELGITYREKGDIDKAIEVLKEAAEKGHIPALNELGITYREKGDLDKAIEVFRQASEKGNLPSLINISRIYLFFNPNKNKAQYYLRLSFESKYLKRFKKKSTFTRIAAHLDEICNLSTNNFWLYDRYTFYAVFYEAYASILPLLEKLKERYPNEPKITGRLAIVLDTDSINRQEESLKYFLEAIDLYEKSGHPVQKVNHIVYYLHALHKLRKFELIEETIEKHHTILTGNSKYHLFLATYYAFLKKPVSEVMNHFQLAVENAKDKKEFTPAIKRYINFLKKQPALDHSKLIESLTQKLKQF